MPTGRELVLGTLFKGRVDATFITTITRLENAIKKLNAVLILFNKRAATSSRKARELGNALATTSEKPKQLAKSTEIMNKQIGKATDGYSRFMGALKVTASYGVAAAGIYQVINALRAGIAEIGNYDQSLKNLQAITGATDHQVESMGGTILNVAKTTKFSTTEIADGMVLLGQSGFSAEESIQAIQATADLASGTLSDMTQVTDLLTTTIRAFGLDASEASRVADVMGNAINRSKLTVDKLRIAFNFVAASASQAGLSLEETAASMMTLANNGIRASTIGTGLRQVLAKMIAPSEKLRETMESYGIEINKINPSIVGFEKALENLSAVLLDSETGLVDMGKAFDIFKLRGAQAAAILVQGFTSGDWDHAMDNAMRIGTAAEMAAIQLEGMAATFKNVKDRAGVFAIAIGEGGVAGAIHLLLDAAKVLIEDLTILATSGFGQVIIKAGLLAAGIGAVTLAIKGLAIASKAAGLVTILANPMVQIALAAATLVATFVQLAGASERLSQRNLELAMTHGQAAASLNQFRVGLEKTHEEMMKTGESREYENMVQRLITAHPELADKIDIATASFEELKKALMEMEDVNIENKLVIIGDELQKAQYEFQQAGNRADRWATIINTTGIGALANFSSAYRDWINTMASGEEEQQRMNDLLLEYINTQKLLVTQGKLTVDEATANVEELLETNRTLAEQLDKEVIPAFERWAQKSKEAQERARSSAVEVAKAIDPTKQMYIELYKDLEALSKTDLMNTIKTAERKIAAIRKAGEQMGQSEIDIAAMIQEVWNQQIFEFELLMAERVKGEKLTAEESLIVWQEFNEKIVVLGEFRQTKERELQAAVLEEKKKATDKALKLAEQAIRKEAAAKKRAMAQAQRDLDAQNDLEIQRKAQFYERLARMDEVAVARGQKTQEKADQDKKRREREFLKFIMEIRQNAVKFSEKMYGKDSDNYVDALKAKEKAEADYQEAQHERRIELIEEQNEAHAQGNEENVENFKGSMDEIDDRYKKTVSFIKRDPIVVDADISPAQAALDTLLQEYRSKIASWMAIYAESVTSGMTGISGQLTRNYAKHIQGLQNQMRRITDVFKNNPILGPVDVTGGVGVGGAQQQAGAPATGSSKWMFPITGGTPGTESAGSTINWNIRRGQDLQSLQVINEGQSTRDTIDGLGQELGKMELSYG